MGITVTEPVAVQQIEPVLPAPPSLKHWSKPDLHHHKVNFDAAVLREVHSAGIGVIIRDWRGEFVGALSVPMMLTHSELLQKLECRELFLKETQLWLSML